MLFLAKKCKGTRRLDIQAKKRYIFTGKQRIFAFFMLMQYNLSKLSFAN